MKRTSYFLILIVLAATFFSGCVDSTEEATSESEDMSIGALLPLTGELSSIGEASQVALELSERDINGYFSDLGSGKNVNVVVKDTGSDPATALEQLQALNEMGIKIVIGPQSSDEAEDVLDYANENGILLISTASTAPSLAIPDDNLFRLVPDDTNQGLVLATFINSEGSSTVIPMYRDSLWGSGLVDEVTTNFEDLNGTVLDGVPYDSDSTDLSAEVKSLNEKVLAATSENEEGTVAVLLCSYEEVTDIFTLAQNYPALSEVIWYGTDGIALNDVLLNDETSAAFAVSVEMKAPMYGYVRANDRYQLIGPEMEEELGRLPDSYALTAYDALWIATFVHLDGILDNAESLKIAMNTLTDSYFGMSGRAKLNENGDREYWDYDIWTISGSEGEYKWQLYGKMLLPYKNNMLILRGDELGFAQ